MIILQKYGLKVAVCVLVLLFCLSNLTFAQDMQIKITKKPIPGVPLEKITTKPLPADKISNTKVNVNISPQTNKQTKSQSAVPKDVSLDKLTSSPLPIQSTSITKTVKSDNYQVRNQQKTKRVKIKPSDVSEQQSQTVSKNRNINKTPQQLEEAAKRKLSGNKSSRRAYEIELNLASNLEIETALNAGILNPKFGHQRITIEESILQNLQNKGLSFKIIGGVSELSIQISSDDRPMEAPLGDTYIYWDPDPNYFLDSGNSVWVTWNVSSAPASAKVTSLEYRTYMGEEDSGETDFWCSDYIIALSSEPHGQDNSFYRAWNRDGGHTDGGEDDDSEDDYDIYLNWRSTSAFNGEEVNQQWYAYYGDEVGFDDGNINYIEMYIYWEIPNLVPYAPSGWDYPVVPSSVSGTHTVGPDLTEDAITYIDWACANYDVDTPAQTIYYYLYFDGSYLHGWYTTGVIEANHYVAINDWEYTVTNPGYYYLGLDVDAEEDLEESDEGDNYWEHQFYWRPLATPNLTPYRPSGWDHPLVPSSVSGTHTVGPNLTEDVITYIDWACANYDADIPAQTIYYYLYFDGSYLYGWYSDFLFEAGTYITVTDWEYTVADPGTHSLEIEVDAGNDVTESNEGDNTWIGDFYWEVYEESIVVDDPNGGESWEVGSVHDILWHSSGPIGYVDIEYSTNGGSSWNSIVTNIEDNGSYSWTIPNTPSSNCLVKVADHDGWPHDQSNAVFTISGGTQTITVNSPNGGEIWAPGSSHTISWSSTGTSGNVRIEYSTNGGADWSTIVSSTSDDGNYSWTIPNTPSTNCFVRITDTDGSPSDQSNSPFEIGTGPDITVISPNGGEVWDIGTQHTISWSSSGTSGNVRIEYSTNGGSNWTTIVSSTLDDNSHSWTIPNTPSTNCYIRITDTDGSPSDQSNNPFTINISESITVTTPNGGEVWSVGTTQNIIWTSSGTSGTVRIEYSTNGGSNWSSIISSTTDDGSHSWMIPNTPSANCFVRITDTDGSPSDQSNAPFEIVGAPQHFIPVWSGNPFNPMTIYCTKAELNGQALVSGDEIGVFDGTKCVGAVLLSQSPSSSNIVEIICSKDDGTGNGFIDGNQILFKVWDQSAVMEHGALAQFLHVEFGYPIDPVPYSGLGTALVELTAPGTVQQSIFLYSGWNMFSLAVTPEGIHNMMDILNPILNQLVKVIDEQGHSIVKIFGNWNNSIGNWLPTEGYYINVLQDVTLTVSGTEIITPFQIPLNAGWNIISYPCLTSVQNAMSIVQPLIDSNYLVKVIDEQGHSIVRIFGNWNNSIGDMQPGEGYYVNVNTSSTLDLTCNGSPLLTEKSTPKKNIQPRHFTLSTKGFPFEPMNIFVVEACVDDEYLNVGDEIAVFDGDQCVGVSILDKPVSAGYPLEIIASKDDGSGYGFTEGHEIGLKIWRSSTGEEVSIDANGLRFIDPNTTETTDASKFDGLSTAVVVINLTTTSVDENVAIPQNYCLYQNHPNPFNPTTTIAFDLPEATDIRLEIYDLRGNIVKRLHTGIQTAGHHVVEWNGTNIQGIRVVSGIYFYKMISTGKFTDIKKMILIK